MQGSTDCRRRQPAHLGAWAALRRTGGGMLGAAVLIACFATSTIEARVLRVAADPNNLPFTNERLEGFENRIAELVAAEIGATLEYMWWPQRRGFFPETIGSGRADLVMGVPARFERVLTTRPYYTFTYVAVQRTDRPPVNSLDDAGNRAPARSIRSPARSPWVSPAAIRTCARKWTPFWNGRSGDIRHILGNYGVPRVETHPAPDSKHSVAAR